MFSSQCYATRRSRLDWSIRIGVAVLASVIAALLGPFTTYEKFTFLERLAYWTLLTFGVLFPATALRLGVLRLIRGPVLQVDLVAAGVIALVFGPIVWAINVFMMNFDVAYLSDFLKQIALVFLICLGPVILRAYVRILSDEQAAESTGSVVAGEGASGPAFLQRLEADKRGTLWRVSANDHQLVVSTSEGETQIRMRFSDALTELEAFEGARLHRSHWVAFHSIVSVVQDGRRHSVRLQCGTDVPVSRTGVEALQQAGIEVPGAASAREPAVARSG